MKKPHIVVLDGYTMNPGDLDWSLLKEIGEVNIYDRTPKGQIISRSEKADIIITNKVAFTAETIEQLPNLRFICVSATGYNVIDIDAANKKGIQVSNVKGYSTPSVAQHVIAMMLNFTNQVNQHSRSVHKGKWSKSLDFSFWRNPLFDLAGQTLGIIGFGQIGQQLAKLAKAFEMNIVAVHKHPERDAMKGVEMVDQETLLKKADFISLHVPLTEKTDKLVNATFLSKMKPSAILINTGRGQLIDESALKLALINKKLAGAALDVLTQEPPPADHILYGMKNCIITPHIAWASTQARQRLYQGVMDNIQAFLDGKPVNLVN